MIGISAAAFVRMANSFEWLIPKPTSRSDNTPSRKSRQKSSRTPPPSTCFWDCRECGERDSTSRCDVPSACRRNPRSHVVWNPSVFASHLCTKKWPARARVARTGHSFFKYSRTRRIATIYIMEVSSAKRWRHVNERRPVWAIFFALRRWSEAGDYGRKHLMNYLLCKPKHL